MKEISIYLARPMQNIWELLDEKEHHQKIRIGKAASKVFNEKGYLQTTMKDIAVTAQMSKGGIFHYFTSKNEILFFILNNYMDFALRNLEQELAETKDPSSKIKFIISRHIDFYLKNLSEGKTLFRDAHLLPAKYFDVIARKEREYYKIAAGVLSEILGDRLQEGELAVVTFALIGMCNWTFSWYKSEGLVTPENLSSIIYDIFSRGVSRGTNL